MILTAENYYSKEASLEYMGSTQFKKFLECEASAVAEINGEISEEITTALLVGSYVDAHFEGTLDIFKAKNPEIFTKKGELKADYAQAEYIIERVERDKMFMNFMSGEKQKIMTGKIEEVPFKIKIDSYLKDNCIVDLKVIRDFQRIWIDGKGKTTFVEAWGYDIQAAIYQEIEFQNSGKRLPFYIAAATKEKPEPDLAIISIPQAQLDFCLRMVKLNVKHFDNLKHGLEESARCEKCDYCKKTKQLCEVVNYLDM